MWLLLRWLAALQSLCACHALFSYGAAYKAFDGGGKRPEKRSIGGEVDSRVEAYLTKFGYLPQSDLETGNLRSVKQLEDAVRNLQGFAGLQMTGKVDPETRQLLIAPRCGVQDVSLGYRNRRSIRVKRYNLQGQRWSHTNLTWSLRSTPTNQMSRDVVRRELTYALRLWETHTRLSFTETWNDEKADIQVFFHRDYHGDGYPFDGPGAVLAHAFFPGAGRGGDAHFDADETWSEARGITRDDTSLFAVAVHEFGHSLGLSHSSDKTSLMFPWYSSVPQGHSLPKDDLEAIQHLYGASEDSPYPTYPEYPGPTSTVASIPRTRPTNPPAEIPQQDLLPDKCDTNFDAVAVVRSEMWVFKGKYFWRINKEGGSREDPMELSSFWYGLPSDIDHVDAVYERNDNDIVFFVGNRYYVMAGNAYLKQGPRPITDMGLPADLARVDGAMRWGHNDKTYFFSGDMYWRYDEEVQHIELDYPRDIQMWKGVPYDIDGVFQYHNKKTYFFKGKKFWEFDDERMEVTTSSPTLVGEYWLHCPKELVGVDVGAGQPQVSSGPSIHIASLICLLSITAGIFFTHCIP